jgi:hypothetical protein
VYPLAEVLLLLTRATIVSRDDFDDVVAWGEHPPGFSATILGVSFRYPVRALAADIGQPHRPGTVRTLFRKLDCGVWARPARSDCHPDAIDGKTSRRTHDTRKRLKALHMLSA